MIKKLFDLLTKHERKRAGLLLGMLVFVLLVVSLAFKALTTYAQLRFTLMRDNVFSTEA